MPFSSPKIEVKKKQKKGNKQNEGKKKNNEFRLLFFSFSFFFPFLSLSFVFFLFLSLSFLLLFLSFLLIRFSDLVPHLQVDHLLVNIIKQSYLLSLKIHYLYKTLHFVLYLFLPNQWTVCIRFKIKAKWNRKTLSLKTVLKEKNKERRNKDWRKKKEKERRQKSLSFTYSFRINGQCAFNSRSKQDGARRHWVWKWY